MHDYHKYRSETNVSNPTKVYALTYILLVGENRCFPWLAKWGQKGFTLICALLSLSCFSQGYDKTVPDLSAGEKIYLQLAPKVFTTDQTIWFKAIVTDTETHMPTKISGVLYVDLIDPNEQIVSHKLVKLSQGIGNGSFNLQENYAQGRYLVRAYTQWNLNFGNDFMFKAYVDVHAPLKDKNKDPIGAFTLVEGEKGRFFLRGQLWPQRLSGTSEKQTQVYLDWGHGKDTITVKRRDKVNYTMEYEVPADLKWVTLTLDNGYEPFYTKTIVLNDSPPDVQFFPESGKIVGGFLNKIGFKAVSFDGKGVPVHGIVFDAQGNKAATFKSNHLGMGAFYMEADSNTTYHAKVFYPNNKDSTITYSLPKVVQNGSILSVIKLKDRIRIDVASNSSKDQAFVKASCRGVDYYSIEGPLRKGHMVSELLSDRLPEGIIVFTLMDGNKVPVAERLYFNESDKNSLNFTLKTNKDIYGRREETRLDIRVSGNTSAPPNTDLSVMVLNNEHWHQGKDETISSYFLLDSELKGEIEEPGFYFSKENPSRASDLDALLLTQGWRNYKYPPKRQGRTFFWPQPGLEVKGSVRPNFRKKEAVQGIDMSLVTFGRETSFYTQQADSLGRFNFLLDDTYGQRTRILLSAKNAVAKETNYAISLDTLRTPKVVYEHMPRVQKLDSVVRAVIQAQQKRQNTETVFDSLYGVTQLKEVVVEGYRLTPEREKAYKRFGEPDVVISGDAIRKKEKKWSYGLYSILLFNYGDQIQIEQFSDGFMLAHIIGGRREPTLLVVDGRLLQEYEYEFVPQMSPNIVESVELIKYAKFFRKQFLTVFPETDPLNTPSIGHIISIYTKGGVGIHASGKPVPGTLSTMINVFSPVKEFYAPKYDRPIPTDKQKPDLRSLIHWVPSIKTDEIGTVSASFYNNDVTGDYVIIVEAISKDGRIGYQEKTYHVGEEEP